LLTHLEFSQHYMSVGKRSKSVKPIAVGYVNVISHDALFALCIKLLWAKLFLKRVPRPFWKKVCIT